MPWCRRPTAILGGFDHAQRWFTIGRHGSPWTPESARRQAFRILGDVARGIDPALQKQGGREAITFGELCDLYLAEGKKRDRLWTQVEQTLRKLEFPESRIVHLMEKRDPALLVGILKELSGGA